MTTPDSSLRDRVNNSPLVVTLLTIGIVSAGLTSVANITGYWQANHTTQLELEATKLNLESSIQKVSASISEAKSEREEIRNQSSCQNLDILISIVESQIWQMRSVGDNSQRLVEKERELKRLEEKRRSLSCINL